MKPLRTLDFAIASALALALLSAACAIAVVVAPDATIALFNSFMHGVDLSRLIPPGGRPVTGGHVIGGMLALGAIGFIAGGVVAALYNAMGARGRDQDMVRASRGQA
jgi:hypothetical protein